MGRSKRGGFKNTPPEQMLAAAFQGVLERGKADPKHIDDIAVGNALQPAAGQVTARMAQFMAGIPETAGLMAVNRQCSSGLQACLNIAESIIGGRANCGIGSGVESMSYASMMDIVNPDKLWEGIFENENARNCMMPMGITSENVATKYGITREMQDQLAVDSHAKAAHAQENGYFTDEIVPVKTKLVDKDGNEKEVVISKDEGIRKGTTLPRLAKLKPAFKKGGSTTAGNSSQVSDGAAAVLIARRSFAKANGMPIVGRFVGSAIVGVPVHLMGIGPACAIPVAVKRTGLKLDDIDIFEINEAFASQATYCVENLKIDRKKLNPKGGAIALGHPLGMTGARMVATLLTELKRTDKKFGVISMCIGTGMGAAAVVERE